VSQVALANFERDCRSVYGAVMRTADAVATPERLEVILTADLEQTVRQRMRVRYDEGDPSQFQANRFGLGQVVAKNLPQDDQYDHVIIVFDRDMWPDAGGDSAMQAQGFLLLAHELTHPLLQRTRIRSGVAKDVVYPSWMPGEIARSMGRTLMDEYRADWMADVVLQAVASKGQGGEPLREWELDGAFQLDELRKAMLQAHEQIPQVVQDYRERRIDLMTMWPRVTLWTEYVLTAFVHVRAAADGMDPPVPVLQDSSFSELPFVRLYLSDVIVPFLAALRRGPLLPTPTEWVGLEPDVTRTAETLIREIWRRLGLTFVEPPTRGQYRINVGAPLR